ncbi:MAG: leucine-rich repeat protein [Oscillospiraceae bacterium]|nr:leucine-rich repeat protein [Oscillospiraceae bacterium]
MKKRILSVFLAMAISIGFISGGMLTASAATSGDGWSLDDNGLLIISSDSAMPGFKNTVCISGQPDLIIDVIIEEGVTFIGDSAFVECKNLKSIIIPNTVKSINNAAFAGCEGLTSIIIPDSVISISIDAFFRSGLTSVTIPKSVMWIGPFAFAYSKNMTEVTFLSSTPPELYNFVFGNCDSLSTINVPVGSLAAYQAIEHLGEFNIVEFEPPVIGDCNRDDKINIADLTYLKRVVVGYMPEIFINRPECWLTDETKRTQKPEARDLTQLKDFLTGKISSL